MKIGIYCGVGSPVAGGANSLIKTIQKELREFGKEKFEYVFLFSDKSVKEKEIFVEGIRYINVIRQISLFRKIRKKINFILGNDFSKDYRYDIIARREDIDVFWFAVPTFGDISYPYIYTVWDLGHRTTSFFPEVSSGKQWNERENMYSRMIEKASYVLTGNNTGREEIINNYNVSPDKIRIAEFPVSAFCYGEETKPDFIIDGEKFFFYPAQFWSHKNHIRVVEAVKILKNKGIETKVYFTGADHGNRGYIAEKIYEYGLESNIVITGFLKDEEIKYLYKNAVAMIFASLMGPNNLPPIEAMALKCPVIISDIKGHKEQMGECALYFDGLDAKDLSQKMLMILNDNVMRREFIQKANTFIAKVGNVHYCDAVFEVLEEFEKIRNCWGNIY